MMEIQRYLDGNKHNLRRDLYKAYGEINQI